MSKRKKTIESKFATGAFERCVDGYGGEARHILETLRVMVAEDAATAPSYRASSTSARPEDRERASKELSALIAWYESHTAFHDEENEPLESVVTMGKRLWTIGGRRLMGSVIDALPARYRQELNFAFAGCGRWTPLKSKWK